MTARVPQGWGAGDVLLSNGGRGPLSLMVNMGMASSDAHTMVKEMTDAATPAKGTP